MNKSKVIALTGGGTGGPVTPLLAVAGILRREHPEVNLIFIGGNTGPEKELAKAAGLEFESIPTVKWRRYFSWTNIYDIFILPIAVLKSMILILRYKVNVVVNAGSYVGVPVIWAAWLLRKKILIHHQDLELSLSTRLTRHLASVVTTVVEEQKRYLPKALVIGNAVREFISRGTKQEGRQHFGFDQNKPLIFVYGGGSGALGINQLIEAAAPNLLNSGFQILHQTGKNKTHSGDFLAHLDKAYVRREFLTSEAGLAYAAADLVISRAGMANITELSFLAKPAIVIPMPSSHQEKNAEFLEDHQAAKILHQEKLDAEKLYSEIFDLLRDDERKNRYQQNISKIMSHSAADTIAQLVYNLT